MDSPSQFAHLLGPILVGRTTQILSAVHNVFHVFQTHTNLSAVHNIFYISMLRKYTPDPSHVLAHDTIFVREDLTYKEDLIQILDREVKLLRNKEIVLVKTRSYGTTTKEEANWEREKEMRILYQTYFKNFGRLKFLKGGKNL